MGETLQCITPRNLQFLDLATGEVRSNLWNELKNGLWKEFSAEIHLDNYLLPPHLITETRPCYPNFLPIVPGTRVLNRLLQQDLYSPKCVDASFDRLLEVVQNTVDRLKAKKIGVHLSGGLDSSLIMSLLHHLNIPFVPIGLKSETFEFRTERVIQEKYMNLGDDGEILSLEDYPFYGELRKIPLTQLPPENIKSISSAHALARAFRSKGCDLVLSGQGGDSLLVDECLSMDNLKFNRNNEFVNDAESEFIYSTEGIRLTSFYDNDDIIDILSSLRNCQPEDPGKLWARKFFSAILPDELVKFHYVADFFGLSKWGLHRMRDEIFKLLNDAYKISKAEMFSPQNVKTIMNQDILDFDYLPYIKFCGTIAIASWYHNISKI